MTPALSKREREVVELLSEGHTQKVVAARLEVSQRRVENLIASAKAKYGASSCSQLVHMWDVASTKSAR